MKKKLEEFFELEKKATEGPWETQMSVPTRILKDKKVIFTLLFDETENAKNNAQFIAQSRTIAPQAVRELMEAARKIEHVAYALSDESYLNRYKDQLLKELKQFTEDFDNEN